MPTATPTNLGVLSLLNGSAPCEGAKCVPFIMDFSTAAEFDFDFTAQYQAEQFTTIQCAYVDNTLNASNLTIGCNGSGQTIVVPKNSAGYFPLLAQQPPRFTVVTVGVVKVYIAFLNFYIPPTVWAAP